MADSEKRQEALHDRPQGRIPPDPVGVPDHALGREPSAPAVPGSIDEQRADAPTSMRDIPKKRKPRIYQLIGLLMLAAAAALIVWGLFYSPSDTVDDEHTLERPLEDSSLTVE